MRAARRRITSGSNRLRVAVTPFARSLGLGLLFGQKSRPFPPGLLLRRRPSGHARGSSARYTDCVAAAHPSAALSLGSAIRRVSFPILSPAQPVALMEVCATFQVHRLRKKPRPDFRVTLNRSRGAIWKPLRNLHLSSPALANRADLRDASAPSVSNSTVLLFAPGS